MKKKITIPSTRAYLDEGIPTAAVVSLKETLRRVNDVVEYAYNMDYDMKYVQHAEKFSQFGVKVRQYYSERYGAKLTSYYETSTFSTVSGMMSSQIKLQRLYSEQRKLKQTSREEKICSLEEKLEKLRQQKAYIVSYYKASKNKAALPEELEDFQIIPKDGARIQEYTVCVVSQNGKSKYYNLYKEECYIDRQLKRIPTAILLIKDKIARDAKKDSFPPRRVTFGGRKHYKKKDTLNLQGAERKAWHAERDRKRYGSMLISGRHDSKFGNWVCRYDPDKETAFVRLLDGTDLVLSVRFPYRGTELAEFIKERKGAVGYRLELRIDGHNREYIILKASFDTHNDEMNESFVDGCIGYDVNVDNISVAEVDASGNCKTLKTIYFNLDGLSTDESKQVLAKAVGEAFDIAQKACKPSVWEDLDFVYKKGKLTSYGNAQYNQMLSSFAYHTVRELIESISLRTGVGAIFVEPDYTSFIGKVKYMRQLGCPIHCAAAYVIARRGLGLNESIPEYLRNLVPEKTRRKGGMTPWQVLKKKVPVSKNCLFRSGMPTFQNVKAMEEYVKRFNKQIKRKVTYRQSNTQSITHRLNTLRGFEAGACKSLID